MDHPNTAMLAVSKVCHEIANYLSVMKFLGEDLKNIDIYEVKELLNNVDLLAYTMDFFRSIYSVTGSVVNIIETTINIAKLKQISILDENNALDRFQSSNAQNVISGVLYLIIKICKANDNIIITNNEKDSIEITISNIRFLPAAVCTTFNTNLNNEDVYNVFVVYIKNLASIHGYQILVNTNEETGSNIKILRKKLHEQHF